MARQGLPEPRDRFPAQRTVAWILLGAVSLSWGLNWPIAKVAVNAVPVLPFRTWCLVPSGPLLFAVAILRGDSLRVPRAEIGALLIATLFNITLWQLLTATAISMMAAGRASIIAYTMPVWAVLFGAIVLRDRLTIHRVLALVLGMAGLAILIVPDIRQIAGAPLGACTMVLAAMSWAAGSVAMKRFTWTPSLVVITAWQVTLGGIPILLAAVLVGPFPGLEHADVTALAAIGYSVVVGIVFCQWAWFLVLQRLPVPTATIGVLSAPVIALISSTWMLGETLHVDEIVALVLVLGAFGMTLLGPTPENPPDRGNKRD